MTSILRGDVEREDGAGGWSRKINKINKISKD